MTARDLRRLDEAFDSFLDLALAEADETELTPERRDARRAVCDSDPLAFGKEYFGHILAAEYNDLHREMGDALGEPGVWFVRGHRRSGKSAVAYICGIIHRIALGKDLGPALLGVANRDKDLATKRTKKIYRLIARNRKLCYDYDVTFEQEEAGWYIINGCDLVAVSYNVGLRGFDDDNFKRFALIVADDLYNRQTVESPTDNKRVVSFIESEIRGGLEPTGVALILGNAITEDCPIVVLSAKHPKRSLRFPALDASGESNWPAMFSTETWIAFRDGDDENDPCDPEVWAGDYMDEPLEIGEVFEVTWIRTVNLNLIRIVAAVSSLDPAHGQSPHACLKGLATIGVTDKRRRVLLDLYGRQESYSDFFDYVAAIRDDNPDWNWQVLLFENDFEQWNLAEPYYDDWAEENGDLAIITHYSGQLKTEIHGASKSGRILNLVHPRRTGRYLNADDLEQRCGQDYQTWLAQYKGFGKKKGKLDVLDAEATGFLRVLEYADLDGSGSVIEAATPAEERLFGGGGWDSYGFR